MFVNILDNYVEHIADLRGQIDEYIDANSDNNSD